MHAGDRDGVIDPRDRQLIARGVAQPGAVAQQQRADESGRIGREDGRDGRSQPLRKARGQQAERDGLGRLDMERPAAAGREEQTAADIVIAAAAQPLLCRRDAGKAAERVAGADVRIRLVKVQNCRAALPAKPQPHLAGLAIGRLLRCGEGFGRKRQLLPGIALQRAQKQSLVPAAPGKARQKPEHADRCAARPGFSQQKQPAAQDRQPQQQRPGRGMDGVHIQGGGQREAAGKEAEPSHRLSPVIQKTGALQAARPFSGNYSSVLGASSAGAASAGAFGASGASSAFGASSATTISKSSSVGASSASAGSSSVRREAM